MIIDFATSDLIDFTNVNINFLIGCMYDIAEYSLPIVIGVVVLVKSVQFLINLIRQI
jgi:hypothetical protein